MEELPILDFAVTAEQENQQLLETAAPLVAAGYPVAIFDRNHAINTGFTFKSYLKHVQAVARFNENGMLGSVTSLGVKNSIFEQHTTCSVKQFVDFSKWLRTKAGQDAVSGITKHAKLVRRASNVFSLQDVALESIVQIQRQDFSNNLKQEMSAYQREIEILRQGIRKLEARQEARRQEIVAAYYPVSVMEEVDEDDLNNQCWDMYVAEAAAKGNRTKPRAAGGEDLACSQYAAVVKRETEINFLRMSRGRQHCSGMRGRNC